MPCRAWLSRDVEQPGAMPITSLRYHCRGEAGVPLWSQEGDTHHLPFGRGSIRGIGSKEKTKHEGIRADQERNAGHAL
ncbi:MAG: hypothetical protein ACFFDI_02550 [Promethearchaeota archaeon]